MIKIGNRGEEVKTIQKLLGMDSSDGIFGKATDKAVKHFQFANGLVADGIIGPKTYNELHAARKHNIKRSVYNTFTTPFSGSVDNTLLSDITEKVIFKMWRDTTKTRNHFRRGGQLIMENREILQLHNKVALAYFLGQIYVETGRNFTVVENLNYDYMGLMRTFKYFRSNPDKAYEYGRSAGKPANQIAIASRAYANRGGNGDISSGDGWKYRGMGAKQTTFRGNVRVLDNWMDKNLGHMSANFLSHPERRAYTQYALLSGAVFWASNRLARHVTSDINRHSCDSITKVVNRHTKSYNTRWKATQQFAKLLKV